MKLTKLSVLVESMRSSFWFLPSMMAIGSAVLAFCIIQLDCELTDRQLADWWWIFDGGASGARELVSTVAGSMITVAGVVFSITIVTLSLTSQHFGPRLLRNYLRDRPTKIILGCFVGTFSFCLLVLGAIRAEQESVVAFVPYIGVALAVLFAVLAVFVLVFFIHHTANAIRAPTLAWRTSKELLEALKRLYPKDTQTSADLSSWISTETAAQEITAASSGYIQGIDAKSLKEIEKECGIRLEIVMKHGDFIVPGDTLAKSFGGAINDVQVGHTVDAFTVGLERNLEQDPKFGFDMLVEMAVRSVSPSMDDSNTAIQRIDRIREGLSFVAGRPDPTFHLMCLPTFSVFLHASMEQLSFYARDNPPVLVHLQKILRALQEIANKPSAQIAVKRWIAQMEGDAT